MQLSLYKYDTCGYCRWVIQTIRELGLEDRIEMRDVLHEPRYREELRDARGRGTVPVLRIEDGDSVEWMGESHDIIRWLKERFADGD